MAHSSIRHHPGFLWPGFLRPRILWLALLLAMILAQTASAQLPGCNGCRCAGDDPPNESSIPAIDVNVERIDTGRYPEVDIYFRVVDTNPTTEFRRLQVADVKLEDGPLLGALAPSPIVRHNFTNPDQRALASAVVLDRSSSVDSVLRFIREAILSYISLMKNANQNTYRATDTSVALPDISLVMGLSGDRFLRSTRFKDYDTSTGALRDWVNENLVDTAGGSPIWSATDRAIASTVNRPQPRAYDLPDGSRLVYLISDGVNNRGYSTNAGERKPDIAIRHAVAERIRVYSLGMVFVNNRGIVSSNICRSWLKRMAYSTGGSYFEPINPFPVIEGPPQPVDEGVVDANALPDDQAREYLLSNLITAATFAQNQAKTGPLTTDLQAVVEKVLNPAPTDYDAFIRLFKTEDKQTKAPPPTLVAIDTVDYALLDRMHAGVLSLKANEVTVNELRQKEYYNDQVRNILTKIQASEKTIYRVTHRVDGAPYDGSLRQVKLTVQYRSTVNGVDRLLPAGFATANYMAPALVQEDDELVTRFPIDMSNPSAQLVLGDEDPRGRPWTQDPQVQFTASLMSEIPADADNPPIAVPVATLAANGAYRQLPLPASLPNMDAAARHVQGEQQDYEPLLRSANPIARYNKASREIELELGAKIPMSIPNPDDPNGRPVANMSEPLKPRLQWFELRGQISRNYSYTITEVGSDVPVTIDTSARMGLPTFAFYVRDRTPPTVGVYLTPAGGSTSMVALRPQSADQVPATTKVAVVGEGLGVPGEVRTLTTGFTDPPFKLDGGGSTPGFAVPQNIAVRVQVVAKDNFDKNRDHRYLLGGDNNPIPLSDRFNLESPFQLEARDQAPPYLSRLNWESVGARVGTNFASGFSWRFEEAGTSTDPLADTKVFRAANVTVIGDTFTVNAGQDIFMTVKAVDASGQQSFVRVPILVTPVGLNIGKLSYEGRRGR